MKDIVKNAVKAAAKKVTTAVAKVVKPTTPKRPFDPFGSDLARRAEINARSAGGSWLGDTRGWLSRRRGEPAPRRWVYDEGDGTMAEARELTPAEIDQAREEFRQAREQAARPERGWLDRRPRW